MRTTMKMLTVLRAAAGGAVPSSLLTDLAAYWKMDEAAGATRMDSVGSSHALVNGTVSSVAGKVGNGASFNGNIANYLSVTDNPAINPAGTSWTMAFWAKFNTLDAMGFISKYGGSGGNEFLIDSGGPNIRLIGYGSSSIVVTKTVSDVNTNTFYPVRAWYNLPNNQLWLQVGVDTAVSASGPPGGLNVSNGALRFGVWDGAARPGNCVLDEAGFWRRTLTDDEWTQYLAGITYPFAS